MDKQLNEELEALQKRLDIKSKSEVIRDALGVLQWLSNEVLDKKHLISVYKPEDGSTNEVIFHFLEKVRSPSTFVAERPMATDRGTDRGLVLSKTRSPGLAPLG
jgi:hypothetical protein